MRKLNDEVGKDTIQTAFLNYIEAWHQNQAIRTRLFGNVIKAIGPSKEAKGILFLQPFNKWSSEETRFREEFLENEKWFADLVIGESYWHRKEWTNAIEAYERSFTEAQHVLGDEITGDGLLKTFVAYRLQQLIALQNNPQGKTQNSSQVKGDQK
jgi:hypothetical protein